MRNISSPSLRLMELTTGRPCTCSNAAVITLQSDESIITGMRVSSGSAPRRSRNRHISFEALSMASSMLMSIMSAPALIWERAICSASSMDPSLMRRRNLRLPATLQRSPTFIRRHPSGKLASSSPARRRVVLSASCHRRGACRAASSAMAFICPGVVPQHPPTMFSRPSFSRGLSSDAMMRGVWL